LRRLLQMVWFPATLVALMIGLSLASPVVARTLVSTVMQLDQLPPPPRADLTVPSYPRMLFYLQRSTNANTVVYSANMTGLGQVDPKNPLDIFWRRYQDGQRSPLTFVERTLAYGASPRAVAGRPNEFDANIVSLPEIKFRIGVDVTGAPEAVVQIGERRAHLVSVYVKIDESGFIPELISLDLYGVDKADGKVLHQHLEPGRS